MHHTEILYKCGILYAWQYWDLCKILRQKSKYMVATMFHVLKRQFVLIFVLRRSIFFMFHLLHRYKLKALVIRKQLRSMFYHTKLSFCEWLICAIFILNDLFQVTSIDIISFFETALYHSCDVSLFKVLKNFKFRAFIYLFWYYFIP